jgi:hypothetical protein
MVRDAARRKEKYEAKIDADVMRSRILAHKDSMVAQMEAATADLATLETEVKRVIEGQTTPIFGHEIPAYLNVGRELWKLSRKFSGTTMASEADVILDKWKAKGLSQWALTLIAQLFGVTY